MNRPLPLYMNQQPVEQLSHSLGDALDVKEMYHTIQGEGPFVGCPAVFVRTAGCVLQCPACDTDYTTGREMIDTQSLVEAIEALTLGTNTRLVVITGGEPFRQTITPFVNTLLKCNYKVQIETNGTVFDNHPHTTYLRHNPNFVVVCSPKTVVCNEIRPFVSALKYVINCCDERPYVDEKDGLPLTSLGLHTKPQRPWEGFYGKVYVQPMDTGDQESTRYNIDAAVTICKKFGYTLSLQLHKILGVA